MKVHQFARRFWEHEPTLGCKRLRPLAPKLSNTHTTITPPPLTTFDLRSFLKPPESASTKLGPHDNNKIKNYPTSPQTQVEATHVAGGTRWNPTQEQIGILEMLYRGGMRTPNAEQIEKITTQLSKYGKIEGKNVFYWFQNHKARERQKQKRNNLVLAHSPSTPTFTCSVITSLDTTKRSEVVERVEEDSPLKKSRSWAFEYLKDQSWKEEEEHTTTLELFPLHPELSQMKGFL